MQQKSIYREPLIVQLTLLFLFLGLVPMLLFTLVPIIYIFATEKAMANSWPIYIWLAQGVSFLVVVLLGGFITLTWLAMPIQELIKGARAIAEGDLTYRVPTTSSSREFITLTETFNNMAKAIEVQHNDLRAAYDEREREFGTILQISSLSNNRADLTSTTKRALMIARSILGTDIMALAMYNEQLEIASTVIACGDCDDNTRNHCEQCKRPSNIRNFLRAMEHNLIHQAVDQKQLLRIGHAKPADETMPEDLLPMLRLFDVQRMAIKPLITNDRVIGVLVLMRHSNAAISELKTSLLDTLTDNIAVLIENWHLQNNTRKLTILEERQHLARELHDSVTQSLFTLSLTAQGLKTTMATIPEANQQPIDILIKQTKVIQSEMRSLINELRPIDLEKDHLEDALRKHIQSLRYSTNIKVHMQIQGNPKTLPVPVQQNLNRIAQEALSNIARHAKATEARLMLDIKSETVVLSICDNGVGFDPRKVTLKKADSLGLLNMQERAEILGGVLQIRAQQDCPTTVTVTIPLENPEVSYA